MFLKKTSAFTLIELLIVVAIIGILAAIAVPNFLNAQTRSKIAKAVSNMRTTHTALESYFLDNNSYPPWAWDPDYRGFRWLTTPLAFVADFSAFENPFLPKNYFGTHAPSGGEADPYFELASWAGSGNKFKIAHPANVWLLESSGPDFADSYNASNFPVKGLVYQSSNGLTSLGDIYRAGGAYTPSWLKIETY